MHHHHHDADRFEGRSAFGVRRPLRFLAHKLDLDEKQITALVRILDDVKTERAQADVDDRRALAEFADSVAGEAFDSAKAALVRFGAWSGPLVIPAAVAGPGAPVWRLSP